MRLQDGREFRLNTSDSEIGSRPRLLYLYLLFTTVFSAVAYAMYFNSTRPATGTYI